MKLDFTNWQLTYQLRQLTENDIPEILELYRGNPLYFQHCPPPPSRETVLDDLRRKPDRIPAEKKHTLGIFQSERLIAVLDLLEDFPEDNILWIGLFMIDIHFQSHGLGSAIISSLCEFLSMSGVDTVRLGFVEGNPQAEHFWHKQGFMPTGVSSKEEDYTIIFAEKKISRDDICESKK